MNLVFSLLELVVHKCSQERTHEDQGPPEYPPYLREEKTREGQSEPDTEIDVRVKG